MEQDSQNKNQANNTLHQIIMQREWRRENKQMVDSAADLRNALQMMIILKLQLENKGNLRKNV